MAAFQIHTYKCVATCYLTQPLCTPLSTTAAERMAQQRYNVNWQSCVQMAVGFGLVRLNRWERLARSYGISFPGARIMKDVVQRRTVYVLLNRRKPVRSPL